MKTADAIAEILKREGVDWVIAYPVNHVIEHAAIADIRPVIVRQERTGLHMADAISRVTSGEKLGVFAMQHGPGTENAYGGVAQAYSESVPILVLPMGYARSQAWIDRNYLASVSMKTVTKSAEPITSADQIPAVFRRAFQRLKAGRGGPVLVEIPIDLFGEEIDSIDYTPPQPMRAGPDPAAIDRAADMLIAAKRPVIYAGQGVHWAKAWEELCRLAELLAIPVCTSLEGKSAFDETHPLALGSGGLAIPKDRTAFPGSVGPDLRDRLLIHLHKLRGRDAQGCAHPARDAGGDRHQQGCPLRVGVTWGREAGSGSACRGRGRRNGVSEPADAARRWPKRSRRSRRSG